MTDKKDLIKISIAAAEIGVSLKTIYNWIEVGKLQMVHPGFVSRVDAYEVWLQQKNLRVAISYFQSKGTIRDSYGRFQKKQDGVE